MNKLKLIILLLLSGYIISAQTQKEQYKYDPAGNRILRNPCTSCRLIHTPPKVDPTVIDTAVTLSDVQIAAKYGLNVFPNPTQDRVNLAIRNLTADETATVLVTDVTGKTLLSQNNIRAESQIDMSSFNVGTYFVRVTIGKDVIVYKVLRIQ